jgi:ribosomal protein S18 acetylase RimI-like enzyme
MTLSDIQDVVRVAAHVHPELPESEAIFAERVKLFPEGCLILLHQETNGDNSAIAGYAISHPIRSHQPPCLNTLLEQLPTYADQYYIHDLAILPEYRGRGYAAEGVRKMLAIGERYASTCLVSVYGTSEFWGRFGFVREDEDEKLKDDLGAYGDGAVFMVREEEGL